MFLLSSAGSSLSRPQGGPTQRRSVIAFARTPDYYDLLGVESDASPDDIKAAYRRRAKELHPDVNGSADAAASFRQVKAAYDTLADEGARARYDAERRGPPRMNFFRDVQEEEEEEGGRQREPEGWGRPADPFEVHRRMWADPDGSRTASTSGRGVGGDEGGNDGHFTDPEELLERLSRVMGGGGLMGGGWQTGGRLDPWGSTTSDAWARRVQEQTDNPGLGGRSRPLYGGAGEPGWGRPSGPPHREWDPFRPGDTEDPFEQRRQQGWQNPARPEWQNPRRRWEEEGGEEDGGGRRGGGAGSGRAGGGGGSFRGKPL